jgi:hypothetical protein
MLHRYQQWDDDIRGHKYFDPVILAESFGVEIRHDFQVLPFVYHHTIDTGALTVAGAEAAVARLHKPEKPFKARQRRLLKKLKEQEPLFYEMRKREVLDNDRMTIDYFRQSYQQRCALVRSLAVPDDKVGRAWVNPEAEWLKSFDWAAINAALRSMIINASMKLVRCCVSGRTIPVSTLRYRDAANAVLSDFGVI